MAEITLNDKLGQVIRDVIYENKFRYCLEVGSWNGLGSTQCFLAAMDRLDGPKVLHCLESNPTRAAEFRKNVIRDYVQLIEASSISQDQLVIKDFEAMWADEFNGLPDNPMGFHKEMVRSWWEYDMPLPAQGFLGSREQLPSYDAVLIDGGEFTGYSEYLLLKNKARCFFLDDTHTAYKCKRVYTELRNSPEWKLIDEDPNLRNGFAAFIRV